MLTWYGISVTTIWVRLPFICSVCALACTRTEPRPVRTASLMPARPTMIPPVGKSGPWMYLRSFSSLSSGFFMSATVASTTSPRLCGGILVAIPTAMPSDPLTSRFGNRAGKTFGSLWLSSKFGAKSTVSELMSRSISVAMRASRASVYLIAAAGSPSTLPKFPCPSTSGWRIENSCASLTSVS